MAKEKARKPIQRLGSISFEESGTTKILETLPATQKDRECAVVQKFVGALAHFEHRTLSSPTPGNEPADCLTEEGNQRIGIQVTDAVKQDHAHRRGIQDKYAERVRELLADCYSEFNGLSITLYHRAPDPLSSLASEEGTRFAHLVADKLRAVVPELKSWSPRHREVYRWQEERSHQYAVALIQRYDATDSEKTATVEFSGNFPHYDAEMVLKQAIERKLAKGYSSFPNGLFWLLVYGDEPFLVEDEAVAQAKSYLRSSEHPFDEIWAFFPYAGKELGFPRNIWP